MKRNVNDLKNQIIQQINQNGAQLISGLALQSILIDVIDSAQTGITAQTLYSAGNGIIISQADVISLDTTVLANYATYAGTDALISQNLANYYTINQINGMVSSTTGNTYNKTQINNLLLGYLPTGSTISTSQINNLASYNGFNAYYTKDQIIAIISGITFPDLSMYYTGLQVQAYVTTALQPYYLKTDIDGFLANKSNINHTHSNYLTTDLLNGILTTGSTIELSQLFNLNTYNGFLDYYTKEDVDTIFNSYLPSGLVPTSYTGDTRSNYIYSDGYGITLQSTGATGLTYININESELLIQAEDFIVNNDNGIVYENPNVIITDNTLITNGMMNSALTASYYTKDEADYLFVPSIIYWNSDDDYSYIYSDNTGIGLTQHTPTNECSLIINPELFNITNTDTSGNNATIVGDEGIITLTTNTASDNATYFFSDQNLTVNAKNGVLLTNQPESVYDNSLITKAYLNTQLSGHSGSSVDLTNYLTTGSTLTTAMSTQVSTTLSTEISSRISGDNVLSSGLSTEIINRISGDNFLSSSIASLSAITYVLTGTTGLVSSFQGFFNSSFLLTSKSSYYFTNNAGAISSPLASVFSVNNIYYSPFRGLSGRNINSFSVQVTTGVASSSIYFAFYQNDYGVPGNLISYVGQIPTTSNGLKVLTGLNINVPNLIDDMLFVAAWVSGGTPSLYSISQSLFPFSLNFAPGNPCGSYNYAAGTYSSFPSTFSLSNTYAVNGASMMCGVKFT